jgi:hypothetical protein
MSNLREQQPDPKPDSIEHTFHIRCAQCDQEHEIQVASEDFSLWKGGMNVSTAFPYIPEEKRELIVFGTCHDCLDRQAYQAIIDHWMQ